MAKDIIYDPRYRTRRAASLGQADQELEYGPEPLPIRDVPIDIRGRIIQRYEGGAGVGVPGTLPNGSQDLTGLISDVHSIAGTLVLRRGLIGRVVTVLSTPTLVLNQQEVGGRGYLFLNPAGVVGLTAKGTLVSSTTLIGATTLQTASLGVANYKTLKLFINATFVAGAGPVTFDLETLDPVTGTVQFISQTLSMVATGQLYADLGTLGVDTDFSILVTVPGGTTITFTVGFVLKDGLDGTSAGVAQTIFLGQAGVSTVAGYPILSGKERSFYIMENVQIYAVTAGPSLNLNVFEL
jgi:hypothetical protein